jgi:hypothetical protein
MPTTISALNYHFMELLFTLSLKLLGRKFQHARFGGYTTYLRLLLGSCDVIHCPPPLRIQVMFHLNAFVYLHYPLEFEYWDSPSFIVTQRVNYFFALNPLNVCSHCVSNQDGKHCNTYFMFQKICWAYVL